MPKPTKYQHDHFRWYDNDLMDNCNDRIVNCPYGYPGHTGAHLNQNVFRYDEKKKLLLQVRKVVKHSHFIHDTDRGRHATCLIGITWVHAEDCQVVYQLNKRNLPRWLREELYGG